MHNYEVMVFYTDGSTRTHAVVADTKFNAKCKVMFSLTETMRKYVQSMHADKKATH